MHLSAIKWIDGWIVTRTRVRLVATAGTYPRLFVSFFLCCSSLDYLPISFSLLLFFSRCFLFSNGTREAARYAFPYLSFLVVGSQTSCFFLHFFLFSTSMGQRMTGTAILPEGGGVRGIRLDVSPRTLAPSSGSLSQLLLLFLVGVFLFADCFVSLRSRIQSLGRWAGRKTRRCGRSR